MKKVLVLLNLILFTMIPNVWANDCPTIRKSNVYNINQKLFTIGSDFDILINDQFAGKVLQKIFKWKSFELRNENGELVAKAIQRIFTFGVKIDIYDCLERPIGSVQEDILKSLLKIRTVYSIFNGKDQLVGQSNKLEWFGTDITFYDASKRQVSMLSRPYINFFTDEWVLYQGNSHQVDPRIMFFVAAYKTSVDRDRESDDDDSSSIKK
ncbi:MAG: hypothetical protein H6625_04645 [Bdellovibrionaceae bacterium]|nr:hypothetical protein [Pseudobdellovibrionaceae bacterium]